MIPVVADADTLFGATTRGLLIHLDYQGLILADRYYPDTHVVSLVRL